MSGISNNKDDRRCRKTQFAIKSALLTIMKEKPVAKISISELTDLADVNRKTFYNHYSDIASVLRDLEDEFLERLFALIDKNNIWNGLENPAPFFEKLFLEIQSNQPFFKLLIESGEHVHLVFNFRTRLRDMWGEQLQSRSDIDPHLLMCFMDFIASGTVSILESWLEDAEQVPLERLSQLICSIISGATHAALHVTTKK
ncbi:MAG: TetR-like C-terminal domain-containing protein [Candidatus Fimivivens sp.]|nr:TetR-like C-terminal domain-containing protein [Candidatus Fimivivens sp.]